MKALKTYSILFKGELRAQGVLPKYKFMAALNCFFYIICAVLLFNFGGEVAASFNADTESYRSVIYSGTIGLAAALILFYNSVSIKELTNSYSQKEAEYMQLLGLGAKRKNMLLFAVSLFRTSVITLFLFSPLVLSFYMNGMLSLNSLLAVLSFVLILSFLSFLVNLEFPKLLVSSILPLLIIAFLGIFLSISLINYEQSFLYMIFSQLQKLFLFLIGDYPTVAYLIVDGLAVLLLTLRVKRNDRQFGQGRERIIHGLLKNSIQKQSRFGVFFVMTAQSLNKVLLLTAVGLSFAFLGVVHVQGLFFNAVPTISLLFQSFFYLIFFSEINNKISEADYSQQNQLPVKKGYRMYIKFTLILLLTGPIVLIGLSLMGLFYMIPIYLIHLLIVFLISEYVHPIENKFKQGLALGFIFCILGALFLVLTVILNNFYTALYIFFFLSITLFCALFLTHAKSRPQRGEAIDFNP